MSNEEGEGREERGEKEKGNGRVAMKFEIRNRIERESKDKISPLSFKMALNRHFRRKIQELK